MSDIFPLQPLPSRYAEPSPFDEPSPFAEPSPSVEPSPALEPLPALELSHMKKVEERNEKLINDIARENKQRKSINLLVAAPPPSPAGFGSPLDYMAAHAGFMVAIGLILIPVLIILIIGCSRTFCQGKIPCF